MRTRFLLTLVEFAVILSFHRALAQRRVKLTLSQGSLRLTGSQAVGSFITATASVTRPPALPYHIEWLISDRISDVVIGTVSVERNLKTSYVSSKSKFDPQIAVTVSPFLLQSANDEVKSVLTFSSLQSSHTGYKIGYQGSFTKFYSTPLFVKQCLNKGSISYSKSCDYQCTATYSCSVLTFPADASTAMCLANTNWNVTESSCLGYCSTSQDGVSIKYVVQPCRRTCYGRYTCQKGFFPLNNDLVKCGRNQKWELPNNICIRLCPLTQGKIIVKLKTDPCPAVCLGTYSCIKGYVPSDSLPAQCLHSSKWNVTDSNCIKVNIQKFSFYPEDKESTFAVGYSGVTAGIVLSTHRLGSCAWRYNGKLDNVKLYVSSGCPRKHVVGGYETMICEVVGDFLHSNITFHEVLKLGKKPLRFECRGVAYVRTAIDVKYCSTKQGSVRITHPVSCAYKCIGTYHCNKGSPVNKESVVCLLTAHWNVSNAHCTAERLERLEFFPINGTTFAVGLEGMTVNLQFKKSLVQRCTWLYGGELDNTGLLKGDAVCNRRIIVGKDETITCFDGNTFISSNLTFHDQLTHGFIHVRLVCDNLAFLDEFLAVQHCSSSISTSTVNFHTNSMFIKYSSLTAFNCGEGQELAGTNVVKCMANAKWNISASSCKRITVFNGTSGGTSAIRNFKTHLLTPIAVFSTIELTWP